jgi:hypothetical protein
MGQDEEDIGYEAGFFLHGKDRLLDVVGQVVDVGYGKLADARSSHLLGPLLDVIVGRLRSDQDSDRQCSQGQCGEYGGHSAAGCAENWQIPGNARSFRMWLFQCRTAIKQEVTR